MALIACAIWLFGFEVMPWMHVAFHDEVGAHHHDASGAIVRDGIEDLVGQHAPADHQARIAGVFAHGQHSIAHHGVALSAPAPVVTHPLPVDRQAMAVAAIASLDPVTPLCARAKARDPPASTI